VQHQDDILKPKYYDVISVQQVIDIPQPPPQK